MVGGGWCRCQILEDQKEAIVKDLVCWSDLWSFGSTITPKYLDNKVGTITLVVTEPPGFGLSKVKSPGTRSLCNLGKFISAIFESSKGELCMYDQSNPPPGLSIMPFSFAWQCIREFSIANYWINNKPWGEFVVQNHGVDEWGIVKGIVLHRGRSPWVVLWAQIRSHQTWGG